jgi:nucleoside-diphosphate-sugar epimerase
MTDGMDTDERGMTRILVTGASGFVGRAVVRAFAGSGRTVRAAVRRSPPESFPAGVEAVVHPDLAQSFDWSPYLDGVAQVIHLAGIAHTGGVAAEHYERVNHAATAELAAAAARHGIRHFVFVSSIRAQSGPSADHALTERDEAQPIDAYGRSKLAAEVAVRESGVPFTILRPALFYGPGVKGNFALLLRAARSRAPLPVKDFVNRRSLIGIDNFISALDFVFSSPTTLGETYVVADPGIPPRLGDLIATLRKAQGRRPLLLPLPPHYLETPLRLLRRKGMWERIGGNLRIDPEKLIGAGWLPLHDTRDGLTALVETLTHAVKDKRGPK